MNRFGHGGNVVEFGAGTGNLPSALAPGTFSSFVGYDISDAACEIARARQLDHCRFEAVDMARWPGAKDLTMIVAEECLYYLAIPDLRNFMRLCMDSLNADGTMLVVVHDQVKHAQTLNICRQSGHATEWAVDRRGYMLLAKNQPVPLSMALGSQ